VKFIFYRKLETNNTLKRWHNNPTGKGWAIYKAYKERLKAEVFASNPRVCNRGTQQRKHVHITYYTKKLQDKDNFYGSLKPLLDVLVFLQIIKSDSEEDIELEAHQEVDRGRAYTVIVDVS